MTTKLHDLDEAAHAEAVAAVVKLAMTIPVVSERLPGTHVQVLVASKLSDLVGAVITAALEHPAQKP